MPIDPVTATYVGGSVLGHVKGNRGSSSASRNAAANREFIEGLIPQTINTNFGNGSFTFENLGEGNYNSFITGGPGHVSPHHVGVPDFSNLRGLSDQFAGLTGQFNRLDKDIKFLRNLRGEAGDLKPMVAPGFSELRDARLSAIEDARQATTSNLKDSLARRRVSGSSFGNDAISRTQAEFAKQKSQAEAQSLLEELDATMKIIDFQRNITGQMSQTLISKLSGQQQSIGAQAGIEQYITGTEFAADQFNAAASQHADATNVGIDLAMMQAAFGGTAQALGFIQQLAGSLNGASAIEQQIAIDRANSQGELIGNLTAAGIYEIQQRRRNDGSQS